MRETDLLRRRLGNQKLARAALRTPAEVVGWLGAVQAQDFPAAKWGLALRAAGLTEADADKAFDEGAILRTHVLRPTWHFVTPADIKWILSLTAPRVHAANGYSYRRHGLDHSLFSRSQKLIVRALEGGGQLTRAELGRVLTRGGIPADGQRLAYIMMRAELDGVICSGARRGKEFTYALLDERAPRGRTLDREAALAELTWRYFTSHGPATLRDYSWWSGLTLREARTGIEIVRPALEAVVVEGLTYWLSPSTGNASRNSGATSAHLLPNYDEYLIAYKDRGAVVGSDSAGAARRFDYFVHHLVIDGRLAGSWKRTLKAEAVVIDVAPYWRLREAEEQAVAKAAARYGKFAGKRVVLSMSRT